MKCPHCGTTNGDGRKFCDECGGAFARRCPSCQSPNRPSAKFCGDCGALLEDVGSSRPTVTKAAGEPVPAAERRVVSVLFGDLVGFTSLSEAQDAEDVRELLSRYFDTARRVVSRYGGVIEKFIGDAVMAVWGTPVAQEDDAERAVRAALELTGAIAAIGDEIGPSELALRVGVLTGEAAVTIGAEGEGMVAGDLVNTASRVQSVAAPGTVLVGETTRRATEAAISYVDAGEFEVKGRAEPVRAWRALHVVAARGGAQRRTTLEPPFVGREREMRAVKELFHATREHGKAHLVSVIGIAGIGKSRLSWEFEKYVDGLAEESWWHRGRCLSYGEGVTYWALAEMVRMRAGILEDEDPASARTKLRETVQRHVLDPEERAWIEPELGHLLGFEEGGVSGRDSLFSAWRMFFERMAETDPVLMVLEDLHWADEGLLDFLEHLLEWSRDYPIFLVALARPELSDRRPEWGVARRNLTSLFLEPLNAGSMDKILESLVPGLPSELSDEIKNRAEGVPLYAVETVRMLLDRGAVTFEDDAYRVVDAGMDLEVPETLQALIAARLDGLSPEERRLLQDAAVLGKTFSKQGLSALSGTSPNPLDAVLSTLVRKDLLVVQADPRSPERGQYGFVQALVQKVAYEMLSRRERKIRHLAAANFLEASWGAQVEEIAEVVAAHLLQAYRAAPDDTDAGDIRMRARDTLLAAGERAASLGAGADALRYYRDAAELTDDPMTQAELFARAGDMAMATDDGPQAKSWYERALSSFESLGRSHDAASVSARMADALWDSGQIERAVAELEQAFAILARDEPDEALATLAAQIGRFHAFMGHDDLAVERIEFAIELSEKLRLPGVLSEALNTKSIILIKRPQESLALQERSLALALENDVHPSALRAYYNLAEGMVQDDRWDEALRLVLEAIALCRRVGNRYYYAFFQSLQLSLFYFKGEWDEMQTDIDEMAGPDDLVAVALQDYLVWAPMLKRARGEYEEAADILRRTSRIEGSSDVQELACANVAKAIRHRLEGDLVAAFESADAARDIRHHFGPSVPPYKAGIIEAMEVAMELGDLDSVDRLCAEIEAIPVGYTSMHLTGQRLRMRARLASLRSDPREAESLFQQSIDTLKHVGSPFSSAVAVLEFGEWLLTIGEEDRARSLLDEAQAVFERLRAQPWLDRAVAAAPLAL